MTELIEALRCEQYGDDECENAECPYWSELGCRNGVANRDAADALERLMAEIDRKDKSIQGLLTQIESNDKTIERMRNLMKHYKAAYRTAYKLYQEARNGN